MALRPEDSFTIYSQRKHTRLFGADLRLRMSCASDVIAMGITCEIIVPIFLRDYPTYSRHIDGPLILEEWGNRS